MTKKATKEMVLVMLVIMAMESDGDCGGYRDCSCDGSGYDNDNCSDGGCGSGRQWQKYIVDILLMFAVMHSS